jgi:hypothetical protein
MIGVVATVTGWLEFFWRCWRGWQNAMLLIGYWQVNFSEKSIFKEVVASGERFRGQFKKDTTVLTLYD